MAGEESGEMRTSIDALFAQVELKDQTELENKFAAFLETERGKRIIVKVVKEAQKSREI